MRENGTQSFRFYDTSGVLRPELRVSTGTNGSHRLYDSRVTGGTYRDFLHGLKAAEVCLLLEPFRMRFRPPCPTGLGDEITEGMPAPSSFSFSSELGCLYSAKNGEIFLSDDARSLSYRFRLAEELGISILVAEADVLRSIGKIV